MELKKVTEVIESTQNKIDALEDAAAKRTLIILLNVCEAIVSENTELREINQKLQDENNRLNGLQGKPDIKANNNKDGNISSEQERKEAESSEEDQKDREGFKIDKKSLEKLKENRIPKAILDQLKSLQGSKYSNKQDFINAVENAIGKELTNKYIKLLVKYAHYKKRKRKAKNPEIKIDREVECPVDKSLLPEDAQFKDHEDKIVQNLVIKTDNIKFKRKSYYSPSQNKTYLGEIPQGYEGDFGPDINTQIVTFKYVTNMSIPKIKEFYDNVDIKISNTYISNRLTKHIDPFHHEKSKLYKASLQTMSYQ